jgi:hypothetical protein
MEENIDCYRFKKIYFDDGILNNAVDATYIIHLEGNGRYNDIQKQLSQWLGEADNSLKQAQSLLINQKSQIELLSTSLSSIGFTASS